MENLSGAGETKGTNIWPCHLDAARSPADEASKRCSRGALWLLCRLGWRVMLQDTWPHAAGGGSSDEGQFLQQGGLRQVVWGLGGMMFSQEEVCTGAI